jgi:hypothetical protein
MADLPSITGNDVPRRGADGFLTIVSRPVTQKDLQNAIHTGLIEKFSTKNIKDPTPDQIEYEEMELKNIDVIGVDASRSAARGDKADRAFVLDRTIGPVETRSVNINANISLDDYLEKLDASDATPKELAEAGIVIDVEEVTQDEEDYVADM